MSYHVVEHMTFIVLGYAAAQKVLLINSFFLPLFVFAEVCAVDCGSHGVCIGGSCRCEEGWTGSVCDLKACHPRCTEHGTCKDGKCECHQGWTGEHCTVGKTNDHQYVGIFTTWPKECEYPLFNRFGSLIQVNFRLLQNYSVPVYKANLIKKLCLVWKNLTCLHKAQTWTSLNTFGINLGGPITQNQHLTLQISLVSELEQIPQPYAKI